MCRNVVGRDRLPPVVLTSDDIDKRMEQIFAAAGAMIFEATRELIQNYATEGVTWSESAAAVGKSLVVNGVSAMCGAIEIVDEKEVSELCDEVNDLIAGRMCTLSELPTK